MTYEPKFWNGYREYDISRALALRTPEADDLMAAAKDYRRMHNDGDRPNVARFKRLCKAAGMMGRPTWLRYDAETQDDLIEALLDRALASEV